MQSLNMVEIIIADSIGLLVLFIAAFGNMYRVKAKNIESISLFVLIIILALCCIFEALVSFVDAGSGIVTQNGFTRFINIFGNTIVFLGNVVMAVCWGTYIISHMNGFISKRRIYIIASIVGIYFIAIILNAFLPFVFSVDEDGYYRRLDVGYYMNVILVLIFFFIDPVINFLMIKRKGGTLKFFPIWLFYLPSTVGIAVQLLNYGICTIYVGLSIGICGILLASQNDMIFRDKLTNLYNRFFLDRLKEKMQRKRGDTIYTAMMIDLNGFKKINDNYGHQEGDNALITTANLLNSAIGSFGTIIRYAGDEFVIIINTDSDAMVLDRIAEIRRAFDAYNQKKLVPYELSISLGYSKADLKITSIDELMNEIDNKMYADKMAFYQEHPEMKR